LTCNWELILNKTNKKVRPDYIVCVLTGMEAGPDVNKTWCGDTSINANFTFINASHAALARRNQDRLLVCPKCAKAISTTLKS
jgi:hypothetical protein